MDINMQGKTIKKTMYKGNMKISKINKLFMHVKRTAVRDTAQGSFSLISWE